MSTRLNTILRKSGNDVIFQDDYIPTSAEYLIDSVTEARYKIAAVQRIEDGVCPAHYSDDDVHTLLFPERTIYRSQVTIQPVGLNRSADHMVIQHTFTYE